MFDGQTHYFDWVIFNSYAKLAHGKFDDVQLESILTHNH